jgi:hypothetical protein
MVCVVHVTGLPARVRLVRGPVVALEGRSTWAWGVVLPTPAPRATVKESVLPLQESEPNEEPLRPSSQSSIWVAVTTGTPRAWAAATMAAEPAAATLLPTSVCMLAVTTPYQPFGPTALSSRVAMCSGMSWPDSSVIWVVAWKTSTIAPARVAKRMGRPDPVKYPGRPWIQDGGQ